MQLLEAEGKRNLKAQYSFKVIEETVETDIVSSYVKNILFLSLYVTYYMGLLI
jgi:hypothetical protein